MFKFVLLSLLVSFSVFANSENCIALKEKFAYTTELRGDGCNHFFAERQLGKCECADLKNDCSIEVESIYYSTEAGCRNNAWQRARTNRATRRMQQRAGQLAVSAKNICVALGLKATKNGNLVSCNSY